MLRRFSVNFALISMGIDAVLINLSLWAATQLRPLLGFLPFAAHYPYIIPTPWQVYVLFTLEWLGVFLLLSVYDGRKNLRLIDEFANVTTASFLASIASAGTLFLSYREVSRLLFLSFSMLSFLCLLSWRWIYHKILQTTKPRGRRKILVVGSTTASQTLIARIESFPQYEALQIEPANLSSDKRGWYKPLCQKIEMLTHEQQLDDVVLALPHNAYQGIEELILQLHQLPVKVWLFPDYVKFVLFKSSVEDFAGTPLIDLKAPALNEYQRMVKRAFDLLVSIISLPLLLPVMGFLAILIRLDSAGPSILKQERVGENGRLFKMYKFRTMIAEAENLSIKPGYYTEEGHFVHKASDDARITRLGKILRRTSLDEIPQVFNVLKGEMSLVGPRPELPSLVEQYDLWQRQRFAVPQGITGWWQIHGRSDRPMHLHTQDDLYYVQNYSLWLDIYILFKTIGAVISGQGAF